MKDQEQFWAENEKSYRYVTPREFAEEFQLMGISLADELATEFEKSKSHLGNQQVWNWKVGIVIKRIYTH
jgi:sugar-specific transcriptional regulator TrmB